MNRGQFDEIWMPRLGPNGAEALWRWRKKTLLYVASPILAGAGATLVGIGGTLEVLGGVALLLLAFGLVVDFLVGQRRLKVLMSQRFGVRVKGFPAMNQRSFDRWCQYHHYEQPSE